MVAAFLKRGVLDQVACDRQLLHLVNCKYGFVLPSHELLLAGIRQYRAVEPAKLRTLFSVLAGPGMAPTAAASIVGRTIKGVALSSVMLVSVNLVVELSLEAMASAWPPALCRMLVVQAATESLLLLPDVLQVVERVAEKFVREGISKLTLPDKN